MTIGGLLTVLFVALKLTGHIDWTWLQVCMPVIIEICLVVFFLCVYLVLTFKITRIFK